MPSPYWKRSDPSRQETTRAIHPDGSAIRPPDVDYARLSVLRGPARRTVRAHDGRDDGLYGDARIDSREIDGGEWQTTQRTARLRIALSVAHTEGDIARLVNDLAELAPTPAPTEINAPFPVNA